MAKVYVVYHSGYGHTKVLAEAVHRGAAGTKGAEAKLLTTEEATARLDELDGADAIVFGCPTYMGSMSADMKKFVEATSKKWFTLAWKDKVAGAFTNSGSFAGDKLNTLLGLVVGAMQHGMIYVSLGVNPAANEPEGMTTVAGPSAKAHNRSGTFVGPASSSFQVKPGDAPPVGDLQTAEGYGRRIATIALQLKRGRQ